MFRRLTPRQLVFDLGFSAFCVFAWLVATGQVDALDVVFVLLMASALATRRLAPPIALALAWMGAVVQMLAGMPPDLANLSILAVLYATAAYGSDRVKWLGLISAGVGAVVGAVYLVLLPSVASNLDSAAAIPVADLPFTVFVLVFTMGAMLTLLGLSWTLGLLARTRSIARASREAQIRAEAEERQARRLAIVEQERNRIARDMHDVVAHSLAVVIAQADGARYSMATAPDVAVEALSTISATAREALGDVRLLLEQLRHNQAEGPQPGLADLDRLLGQMRASGLNITETGTGSPRSMSAAHQLAVYRITQEALTNVLRHGDGQQPVDLALTWSPSEVQLRVTSGLRAGVDASPSAPGSLGHGIAGMRERALLVGGTLSAEPVGDRFVVQANIPVPATDLAAAQSPTGSAIAHQKAQHD